MVAPRLFLNALLLLLAVLCGPAHAQAPDGYNCGAGGKPVAGKGCKCPDGKVDGRDAENNAVCVARKAPAPATARQPTRSKDGCLTGKGRHAVSVESAPEGAKVYLERKACLVGTTPWRGRLDEGDIVVIVEAAGYETANKTFGVSAGAQLFVPLAKGVSIEVRADVDANVVGATVTLDGVPQGAAPIVLRTSPARHLVEITKPGFEALKQWIDTSAVPSTVWTPTLTSQRGKFGTVLVDANVPDAEVYIDGNKHPDNTPALISNVPEGVHVIEVRKSGTPWRQTVQVTADRTSKVRAELASKAIVRVVSDTSGARAWIDGIDMGPVPVDINDVPPGEHIVEVKAPGYGTRDERVRVHASQRVIIIKIDLVRNP